ncbi:transcriptional regulator, IclR family [Allomeiothermus silvanus DSM 9946]|uniref:Transcriptional regulator, IclR family n=1 Tax=Allomeiothermus silvanus (strain ATCC 700542 / DSM 9946 / NBRC 106475 / NCIMB 13440 / VI-R2) TaxID=526227 RepID=D7BGG4_ALLS1|nr:helix-turn-helix domain-containing protein [Allomeiothermus silvanus]ADH63780.1 transcriptional regulator, IclR family [Allomeiothermus silvanus DSM 9946]
MNAHLRNTLIALLALAYLATLVMSAGHLTKWFDLSLGELPRFFSIGLAVGLELLAFTLSLASTLEPRLRWSLAGGLFFLLLVWLGNLLAMARVANAPGWEVFAQSLFALGPLVAGKAIGELLRLERPGRPPSADLSTSGQRVHVQTHVHTTTVHQALQVTDRMSSSTQPGKPDERVEQLLAVLSGQPLGPSALARRTGLPKTTVYRLTARLLEAGLIAQTPGGYVRTEVERGR